MSAEKPAAPKHEGRRLISGVSSSDAPENVDDASAAYTLEEGINAVGMGWFQYMLMLYVGFAWMGDAMEMMLLSFLGPEVKCQWGLTSTEKGAITSVVFVGMAVGAYTWGALADAKGRRFGFGGTAVFTAIFGFASAFAPSYGWLLLFRGMVGFGLGGVPVSFGLFLEFVPSSHRGQYSIILQSAWTVGALLEAGLAWIVLPLGGWRWLLCLSTVPLVLLLILFPLLPESPHYLLTKGETQKAEAVLAKMSKHNKRQLPSGSLKASSALRNTSGKSNALTGCGGRVKGAFGGLLDGMKKIFSPTMRRTSILLHYSWVTNALVYYGLVLLTTEIHADQKGECVDKHSDISGKDYLDIFITTCAESVGVVFAFLTVDRLGRIKSMAAYLGVCMIAIFPLLVVTMSVHRATICLFIARAGIVGSFIIIYVYTPEVYPTAIRSFGLGFANSWSRFGGLMAPFVAVDLVDAHRTKLAEGILFVMTALAVIATLFMPFETAVSWVTFGHNTEVVIHATGQELKDEEIEMTTIRSGQSNDTKEVALGDTEELSGSPI